MKTPIPVAVIKELIFTALGCPLLDFLKMERIFIIEQSSNKNRAI
ncbi:MAG: hypothetical protein ACFFDS_06140 [Candidatus Thorarchaeota archaeon]